MARQIRMSPDIMRQRAGQADMQAQNMEALISTMDRLLQTLKGEWEGNAMSGYEDRYNRIRPSLNNAKELLNEISYNLAETARILEETDLSIAGRFRM